MTILNQIMLLSRSTGASRDGQADPALGSSEATSFVDALEERRTLLRENRRASEEETTSPASTGMAGTPEAQAPVADQDAPASSMPDSDGGESRLAVAATVAESMTSAGNRSTVDDAQPSTRGLEHDVRMLTASSRELAASILAHRRLEHATGRLRNEAGAARQLRIDRDMPSDTAWARHTPRGEAAAGDIRPRKDATLARNGEVRVPGPSTSAENALNRTQPLPASVPGLSTNDAANEGLHPAVASARTQGTSTTRLSTGLPTANAVTDEAGAATSTSTSMAPGAQAAGAARLHVARTDNGDGAAEAPSRVSDRLAAQGVSRNQTNATPTAGQQRTDTASAFAVQAALSAPAEESGVRAGASSTAVTAGAGTAGALADGSSFAAGLLAPGSSGPASMTTPGQIGQSTVPVPFGQPQWASALGLRIQSIAQGLRDGMHRIELRLDPPHLGPLQVHLQLFDGQAQLHFASHQLQVRQAVEAALPQLQEALAQAGISLGQTSVGEQFRQTFAEHANPEGAPGSQTALAGSDTDVAALEHASLQRTPRGLVDTFA